MGQIGCQYSIDTCDMRARLSATGTNTKPYMHMQSIHHPVHGRGASHTRANHGTDTKTPCTALVHQLESHFAVHGSDCMLYSGCMARKISAGLTPRSQRAERAARYTDLLQASRTIPTGRDMGATMSCCFHICALFAKALQPPATLITTVAINDVNGPGRRDEGQQARTHHLDR